MTDRRWKHRAWFIAGAALIVFAGGCSRVRTGAQEKKEPIGERREGSVKTDRVELSEEGLAALRLTFAKAEQRELSPSLIVTGDVVPIPDRRAEIGPLVAGRITRVNVNVGDQVRRGAPLVVLQSPEIGKVLADLTSARARLEVARQNFEREKRLIESRATSQREVQQAEGAQRTAEAEVQAARTLLATAGVSDRSLPPVAQAGRLVLSSPIAGTVVARAANVGRNAEPSATLVEVVNLDELWFLGDVFERDIHLVSMDKLVQVEVRAYPGEVFQGRISLIGGTLDDKTRTVKMRVVLPNASHRLRPGMFATARIQGAHEHAPSSMLAVPWAAVQEVHDHRAVFVRISERVFELRTVHTGERDGDLVEILNGLRAGDTVVAEGSFLLKGELLRSTLGEE